MRSKKQVLFILTLIIVNVVDALCFIILWLLELQEYSYFEDKHQ